MSMTDDQVKMLLEGLLAGVGRAGNPAAQGPKKTVEDKMVMRLDKYKAVEKEWKEWN